MASREPGNNNRSAVILMNREITAQRRELARTRRDIDKANRVIAEGSNADATRAAVEADNIELTARLKGLTERLRNLGGQEAYRMIDEIEGMEKTNSFLAASTTENLRKTTEANDEFHRTMKGHKRAARAAAAKVAAIALIASGLFAEAMGLIGVNVAMTTTQAVQISAPATYSGAHPGSAITSLASKPAPTSGTSNVSGGGAGASTGAISKPMQVSPGGITSADAEIAGGIMLLSGIAAIGALRRRDQTKKSD